MLACRTAMCEFFSLQWHAIAFKYNSTAPSRSTLSITLCGKICLLIDTSFLFFLAESLRP